MGWRRRTHAAAVLWRLALAGPLVCGLYCVGHLHLVQCSVCAGMTSTALQHVVHGEAGGITAAAAGAAAGRRAESAAESRKGRSSHWIYHFSQPHSGCESALQAGSTKVSVAQETSCAFGCDYCDYLHVCSHHQAYFIVRCDQQCCTNNQIRHKHPHV